ncbi:MAG: Holliday junction resolvase RuvX [Anaerobacillus sp.]|uniref:Holliday junction resolvase RuvX n=1 Tax=Anaerobacillus sp. TaxID=1872506 RepID=UPI00391C19AB
MRTLGLDVGTKTIGVAASDELGWTAQGVETIKRDSENPQSDWDKLSKLITDLDINKVVVGLPKNMNGTIGPSGEACQQFAEEVKQRFALPVILWDERLTTVAAEKMLIAADMSRKKRKKVIDKMAAVMILQGYLDSSS